MDNEQIQEKGKCCACEKPLAGNDLWGFVMLKYVADWRYPVHGNVITGEQNLAIAILCGACGIADVPILYAVEFNEGEIIYHPVNKLLALPTLN